jgi:hypothetical protein
MYATGLRRITDQAQLACDPMTYTPLDAPPGPAYEIAAPARLSGSEPLGNATVVLVITGGRLDDE